MVKTKRKHLAVAIGVLFKLRPTNYLNRERPVQNN